MAGSLVRRSSEKLSLPMLQGKIKCDKDDYQTELQLIYKRFKASLAVPSQTFTWSKACQKIWHSNSLVIENLLALFMDIQTIGDRNMLKLAKCK
ncbi:hypothetical protein DY000_02045066 [Brassica cretica]|uniref:Uncharacterized protein n=1 Tax=Brassica cretica TaxID=69181 RepID=A0ABQ7EP09_BRACR|nr:hypothetical protein DY000_02045066 [Brassica cretica]